jgi:DDE superfamily endonuclease
MTPFILNRWPRFDNFVALFTTKLGKPAQRHFIALIIALILYDGRKNIASLNRALFAPTHTSSLWRFIGESEWDEQDFEQTRLAELNRRVRRYLESYRAKGQQVPAFLCIDDTNNPKTGTKTPWASYQYSHLAGALIRCYCLVTAVMVVGPYAIPLSFQLYRKKDECLKAKAKQKGQGQRESEYVSKTELAVRLIKAWQPPLGTQPFVLADSWYMCDELFAICKERSFTLIGGLKANRLISTTACPKLRALSAYAPLLPKAAYQLVTLGKQTFQLAGVEAHLKGGQAQAVKVVIGRQLQLGTKPQCGIKHYTYRYFVSSDPTLAVKTISEFYSVRWEIETFHANIKELFGLDHNQCWREQNVWRMWTLVLIAYSYILLEAVEHGSDYARAGQKRVSLGQVVAWHKRQAHRGQAEWVYQQALAGQPLELVLAQFAA